MCLLLLGIRGPQAGSSRPPALELVYAFEAANSLHLERAGRLHEIIAALEVPVALYGVVADEAARQTASEPFRAASRATGVESILLTAGEAQESGRGLAGLPPSHGDRLVLRDGAGASLASAGGGAMERVVRHLYGAVQMAGPEARTDVNFSTWGKVKDLFH